ncbi:MAG: competence/damage-inducible protein A [Actinomycetia bacterium]|nr:competence/damage-inducible protein A [Actinomycetes bacterium]
MGAATDTGQAGASAELIFSGDELLRGDTLNTNQLYLGERLLDLGIFTTHALCVTDDLRALVEAIRSSLGRRPAVLVLSGGLGPTEDDLTREAVAEALDRPLEHREELLEMINARFLARGLPMGESNRKQAFIPRGATAIPLTGTAPGFYTQHGETLLVALPGVPWELKQMWEETVEPLMHTALERQGEQHTQSVRRIRTFGIGESMLAEMLAGFDWHDPQATIGTRAHLDGVTIIVRGQAAPQGQRKLDTVQTRILEIVGEHAYSTHGEDLEWLVGGMLRRAGLTVGVAESCTGGLVGKHLTDVPGSSDYFLGGVTAYDNRVKTAVLGVPAQMLVEHGAVSREVAAAMAEGACRLLGADCALSTTGVAGPAGGTDKKPVGLVYIGSVVRGVTQVERHQFPGEREHVRERAAFAALDLLRRRLLREVPA